MRDETALTTSERTPDVVPRVSTLDGFVEAVSHTKGVGLADVDTFSTLVVRTRKLGLPHHDLATMGQRGLGAGRRVFSPLAHEPVSTDRVSVGVT